MNSSDILRQLPSINTILNDDIIRQLSTRYNDNFIKNVVNKEMNKIRENIHNGVITRVNYASLIQKIRQQIENQTQNSLKPVINATGVILHTNLGRSLLSKEIQNSMNEIAFNYSNLEYDLQHKQRGSRYQHVEQLITELTGSEAALVVNNNAASVLLILDTLARNKEIIVSRGELVEIGGSFRIPEIITSVHGHLKEVGTTNKTHLRDYQIAIDEQTGAILKVHTSNYKIIGFTEDVPTIQLKQIAHQNGLPLITDLGSGLMVDLKQFGINNEPTVADVVKDSDVVAFSGDKLLGGPQAGIIVGKKEYIDQFKHNQLLRALRIDKLTLTALEATFRIYRQKNNIFESIPTLNMLTISEKELSRKAIKLQNMMDKINDLTATIEKGFSEVGGGTFPDLKLPTYIVNISTLSMSITQLDNYLRNSYRPIITRIKNNQIQFDVRTLSSSDFLIIVQVLNHILNGDKESLN